MEFSAITNSLDRIPQTLPSDFLETEGGVEEEPESRQEEPAPIV